MKSSYFTTDDLIASIKRRASIPIHQSLFTNDDFIAFLNEEMSLGLVPSIMAMKEDYLLRTLYVPLVQNQYAYELPNRAVGNKAREIAYIDQSNNTLEMTRIMIGDLPFYNNGRNYNNPYAYYIENNTFNLISTVNVTTGSFAVSYYIRPNQLVLLKDVGVIQAIDRTTGEIFLDKIPTDFSVNKVYDMVQLMSPHKSLNIDQAIASINPVNKSITMDASQIPSNLKVGDHFCIAEQSAIPQIPSDLHVVLAHRAAARCLEALGDMQGLQAANAKLAEFEEKTQNLIDDRVEDSPKKIKNYRSLIRSGLSSRRYRFRG